LGQVMEEPTHFLKGKEKMQTLKVRPKGFTLIELLIVVAIIAILAMIAVPNFLEAQTRAKVSRMRADLRSLANAQEAYFTDWNSYTMRDQGDDPNGNYTDGFRQLTTPVAYVATIPHDAFGDYRYKANKRWAMLEMGTGCAANRQPSGMSNSNQAMVPSPAGQPPDTWFMVSSGPDRYDDTEANHIPGGFELGERRYPWPDLPDNDIAVASLLSLIYDPTNGTVSGGQVYRVGGFKPRGRPFEAFFAGGR